MPETLKRLRMGTDLVIEFPADVARMLGILNGRGYDAEPCDVERAYSAWSIENHGTPWHPAAHSMPEGELFDALMSELEEDRAATGAPFPRVPRSTLTGRQREVLLAIEASFRDRGFPPTIREIALCVGIADWKSRAIQDHLQALQDRGYLTRGAGGRGIRLTYPVERSGVAGG